MHKNKIIYSNIEITFFFISNEEIKNDFEQVLTANY